MSYIPTVTGAEFTRQVRLLGKRRDIAVRFDTRRGKGSHGTLHYGNRKTTVKDRKKEIGPGLRNRMLAQLGLQGTDIQ